MRTADSIEETKAQRGTDSQKTERGSTRRGKHPNSRANLRPFRPGISGNPGGRPRFDVAAALARAVIEENEEEAYKGLAKALMKGNAYVFKELADRGYGKLKERVEHSVDEDLLKALDEGRKRAAARSVR